MTEKDASETIPFFPDHLRTELKVMGGLLALALLIGALGMFAPVGLEEPADPMNTPAHVKPEWYFLALYQLLKYIPKTTGALIPVALLGLILFWPFLDRKPETSQRVQKIRLYVVSVGMLILIALSLWGGTS
jgi:quinol-cytochrome oxidoreductase complex cytochrome b subunit